MEREATSEGTGGRLWLALGAALGLLAVLLGAAGTHVLRGAISETDLRTFDTAVRFQMYHALALIAVGLLSDRRRGLSATVAGWAFAAGILLFCGSLYLLALTGLSAAGALAPVGGISLMVGWGALLMAALATGAGKHSTGGKR